MPTDSTQLDRALARHFVVEDPARAAKFAESQTLEAVVDVMSGLPAKLRVKLWLAMLPGMAADTIAAIGAEPFAEFASMLPPERLATALARLGPEERSERLAVLNEALAKDLSTLMSYPPDSVGGIMDPAVLIFRRSTPVEEAFAQVRARRDRRVADVYVVDDDDMIVGSATLQDLLASEPTVRLGDIITPCISIAATASHEELFELIQQTRVASVPVTDFEGRLIGVVRQGSLLAAAEFQASASVQTMMGVGKDERALSRATFAVRRRLPWLQINLGTAFLAAAVVGLFENTIAQFTALAVLLPVVAGQSGNTGSQALAVTMRALALREIRPHHWPRVALKELAAGTMNGVAVAFVTGVAVFMWSRSVGLAGVIAISMVLSMALAGLSGASIPIVLQRMGQDPAQSSSIILTTVTDVVGFMSFLGLATLASGLL